VGWVTMSERDVRRICVLSEVISERRTVASAGFAAGGSHSGRPSDTDKD